MLAKLSVASDRRQSHQHLRFEQALRRDRRSTRPLIHLVKTVVHSAKNLVDLALTLRIGCFAGIRSSKLIRVNRSVCFVAFPASPDFECSAATPPLFFSSLLDSS